MFTISITQTLETLIHYSIGTAARERRELLGSVVPLRLSVQPKITASLHRLPGRIIQEALEGVLTLLLITVVKMTNFLSLKKLFRKTIELYLRRSISAATYTALENLLRRTLFLRLLF